MPGVSTKLARGVAGAVAVGGAGWLAARRADSSRIGADPRRGRLQIDLGGDRELVRARDGTELSVATWGPAGAPTVILIHGWTCAKEFWTLQIQALRGERRVVAFDLRGHGQSRKPANGDYSIGAFADDLDAVLGQCAPAEERVLLVGHSLGAMTIVAWAGRYPERVEERASAAVLVNSGVGDLVSESLVVEGIPDRLSQVQRFTGEMVLRASAPIPTLSTPISHRVVHYVALGPDASPAEVAFCERLILSCPDDVRGAVGGTLTKLDLNRALAELTVPAVIIAGGRDRLIPSPHSRRMAEELPQLIELIELPRSGHMSPIEEPGSVNEVLGSLAGVPIEA